MSEFNPHSLEPFWDTWYIDSLIGEGSFGSVYKICREEFGTKYYSALKIISIPKTESEAKQVFYDGMDEKSATQYFHDIVEVVYKEIAIMAELKGKTNIVSYEDHKIIKKPDGVGFLILIRMELLESLNDYILKHSFSNADVVNLGKDLCRALILCQKRNLIHRDIKPANIFVSSDGDYKLGDFGIARQLEGAQDGLSIKGTYSYMAPEVYLGNIYDERVDTYSLGMVLYYYLNDKKVPFSNTLSKVQKFSDRQECLRKRFSGEKLPPPALASERLSEVILKACEYEPGNRYHTPEEFLAALEALQQTDLVATASGMPINSEKTEDRIGGEATIAIGSEEVLKQKDISEEDEEHTQVLPVIPPAAQAAEIEEEGTLLLNTGADKTVPKEDSVPDSDDKHSVLMAKLLNRKILAAVAAVLLILSVIGYYLISSKAEQESLTVSEADSEEQLEEEEQEAVASAGAADEENNLSTQAAAEPTPAPEKKEEAVTEIADYAVELDHSSLENCSSIENIELLTSLNISYNRLTSLEELREAVRLDYLNIRDNNIKEIDALSGMERLTGFDATNNQISDLSPLSSLTSLGVLILSNNRISSIDEIKDMKELFELRIDGNRNIQDISTVSKLENLKLLTLSNTGIKDISPLYGLKNLILLDLSNTEVPEEQISQFKSEVPGCEVIQ